MEGIQRGEKGACTTIQMVLMAMKTVAILTTKKLFPPEDGRADIIRKIVQLFDHDAQYEIIVISFVPQLQETKSPFKLIVVEPQLNYLSAFVSVAKGLPLQVALFSNPKIAETIKEKLEGVIIDVLIADMTRTAAIALHIPAKKRILDMDDRLSKRSYKQSKGKKTVVHLGKKPEFLPSIIYRLLPYLQKQVLWYEAKRMQAYEAIIIKKFDWTVLVSEKETKELSEQTGCGSIVNIPNYVDISPRKKATAKRSVIIFFGNLTSAHNLDGALYVIQEIFPLIRARVGDAELWIVGRAMPAIIRDCSAIPGVVLFPDVDNIGDYLSRAKVCLCPLRYGSGIKTKILEAFAFGIPVVTNWVGAEGIPRAEKCMVIKSTTAEIAQQVIEILKAKDAHFDKIKVAYEVLQEHYSKKIVKDKWERIFG